MFISTELHELLRCSLRWSTRGVPWHQPIASEFLITSYLIWHNCKNSPWTRTFIQFVHRFVKQVIYLPKGSSTAAETASMSQKRGLWMWGLSIRSTSPIPTSLNDVLAGVAWRIWCELDDLYCEPVGGQILWLTGVYKSLAIICAGMIHSKLGSSDIQTSLANQRAGDDVLRRQGGLCVEPNPSMHKYFEAYRQALSGSGVATGHRMNPLHLHQWNCTRNPQHF